MRGFPIIRRIRCGAFAQSVNGPIILHPLKSITTIPTTNIRARSGRHFTARATNGAAITPPVAMSVTIGHRDLTRGMDRVEVSGNEA